MAHPDFPALGASAAELQRWQQEARARRGAALETWIARNRAIWRQAILKILVVEWAAVFLMLWSFHTASATAGTLAFWGALGLGDGGFLVIFVRTWRAAEGRDSL